MFQHSLSTASTTLVGRGEANVNLRPETPGKRRQVGLDVRVALQCGIVLPSGNQGREGYVYTLCLFLSILPILYFWRKREGGERVAHHGSKASRETAVRG